jgi:dipeptidyl aminopeptidase/acylaminoacyl peptidase
MKRSLSVLRSLLVIVLTSTPLLPLLAQGRLEDYQRSERLKTQLKDNLYYAPLGSGWSGSGRWAWYLVQTPRGREFRVVNPADKTKGPAFDQEQLARQLGTATGQLVNPYQLPFSSLKYSSDDAQIEFQAGGFVWSYTLATNTLTKKEAVKAEARPYWASSANDRTGRPVYSPDSTRTAFLKNHNLYIRTVKTKAETQLSFDGSEGDYYSDLIRWSPDGRKIVAMKVRPAEKHLIYFVRSSPEDQLQPKLESREYLKPGDALPIRRPQLFLLDEKKHIPIEDALFSHAYNLSRLEWRKDSRAFTFEYNQRGHQLYRVLEVQATDGRIRPIIEEKSPTFIDYSGKRYRHDLADGREILWASERDGWNHLYRYDGTTGKVKNQITKGPWVVREVLHVDEQQGTVTFAAGGRQPSQDPYFVQYYRVNLDGTGLVALTTENAHHAASFSPDKKYFLDTYSRVDSPPVTVLRAAQDGQVLMELEQADISEWQKAGWRAPEVFTAKGRDGSTDIWGIIIRPTNFDPAKKYPVIENIYAGPHAAFTPKSFMANNRSMFELAELGFVVVQLDGMGTSQRSKAFHDVAWKNLKDAGLPDRILWLKAAAQKYPQLDLERVGIYGTSAGGQSSTGALLFHPEFYKVAVSSCGCHDNRMDKIWWNEQWMGYPVGPHYAECSNVDNAAKLQGKLLLLVGEVDDNVDPASTMQLVNALVKANKDFDFLMVPNMAHSAGGDYGERKRRDFFVRHLLGVEPPAWSLLLEQGERGNGVKQE